MSIAPGLLDRVSLFQGLPGDVRASLAAGVEEVELGADELYLFRRGEPGDALFVVISGTLELSDVDTIGRRLVLEQAGPGSYVGELALLDGGPRSIDVRATEPTRLLRVDRADIEGLFHRYPAAALTVLRVVSGRLREADRILRFGQSQDPTTEIERRATLPERLADLLAAFGGSFLFLALHVVWFGAWLVLNTGIVPGIAVFDPFPYGLLTMIVSLEAIFLSCCVLISQDRQAKRDRIRDEIEYAANIKASLEVSQLHVKVDRIEEVLLRRAATGG